MASVSLKVIKPKKTPVTLRVSPFHLHGKEHALVYKFISKSYLDKKIEKQGIFNYQITETGVYHVKKGWHMEGDKIRYTVKTTNTESNTVEHDQHILQAYYCRQCGDLTSYWEGCNAFRKRCSNCNKQNERYWSNFRSWKYRRRAGLVPSKKEKQCQNCNTIFKSPRASAKFCSSKCRLQCHRANKSPAPS